MEIEILNRILTFLETDFKALDLITSDSGQRTVFRGEKANESPCVIKTAQLIPIRVARIQREISILQSIDSSYFPKIHLSYAVTQELISNFVSQLDPKKEGSFLELVKNNEVNPFFLTVEDFVENESWDSCLVKLRDFKNLTNLIEHIFRGLEILWNEKIIHRDIKPENVLLQKNSLTPVIIDLGIAKSLRPGTAQITNPLAPTGPCTLNYAAPEQISKSADLSYKADQFSVGVTAFWILTGKYPYGSIEEIGIEGLLENLGKDGAQPIVEMAADTPELLKNFVLKLLQIEPYKRFRNPSEIFEQLNKIRSAL